MDRAIGKTVVFRVDASDQIGFGHLMRCLTLAQELKGLGARVCFVCHNPPENASALIQREFPEGLFRLKDLTQATEISLLEMIHPIDWLVVDHYDLGIKWEKGHRSAKRAKNLLVIADDPSVKHECDLLLNQNLILDEDIEKQRVSANGAVVLAGPEFALLRAEFREERSGETRSKDDGLKNPGDDKLKGGILFFLGGASEDAVKLMLETVYDPLLSKLRKTVIEPLATHERQKSLIEKMAKAPRVELVKNPEMASLLSSSDIFVGSGGTITWERMCVGLPGVVFSIAENQVLSSSSLGKNGYQIYLGKHGELESQTIVASILTLLATPTLRERFSKAGKTLVDGRGAIRVARKMFPPQIQLERAKAIDINRIFEWRNSEINRLGAFDTNPIAYETHLRWFNNALTSNDFILLLGKCQNEVIGVLTFKREKSGHGEIATISIYMVPGFHHRGYGSELIRSGIEWMKTEWSEVQRVFAEIRFENIGSQKSFANAGFKEKKKVFELTL